MAQVTVKGCILGPFPCDRPHRKSCEECLEEERRWAETWIQWWNQIKLKKRLDILEDNEK